MLSFLPTEIRKKVKVLGDLPNYVNTKQIAMACEVRSTANIRSWCNFPKHDLRVGWRYYWQIETVAEFIYEYRVRQNLQVNKLKKRIKEETKDKMN